jgi:hypothetical protein
VSGVRCLVSGVEVINRDEIKSTSFKMNQFVWLPDDILIDEIFPTLPFEDLTSLCATSRRLHELCQVDTVWFRRLRQEYPEKIADKPDAQSWRDYYLSIAPSRLIPIWMNRQIIDSETFHPTNSLPSSYLRRNYVPRYPDLLILYTTIGLIPIYGIIYMNGHDHPIQAKHYRRSLDEVSRIILSDDPSIIQVFLDTLPSTTTTRSLSLPRVTDRFAKTILSLITPHGILQHQGGEIWFSIIPQPTFESKVVTRTGVIRVVRCNMIPKVILVNYLQQLDVQAPSNPSPEDIKKFLSDEYLPIPTELTPRYLRFMNHLFDKNGLSLLYQASWHTAPVGPTRQPLTPNELCGLIQTLLDESGLLLDLTGEPPVEGLTITYEPVSFIHNPITTIRDDFSEYSLWQTRR